MRLRGVVFGTLIAVACARESRENAVTATSALTPRPPAASSWLALDAPPSKAVMVQTATGVMPFPIGDGRTWIFHALGRSCTTGADCLNKSCVDGVCCDTSSCGTCETCAGTRPGVCTAILNAEDPDTCAAVNGKSCSSVGQCLAANGAKAARAEDCASGYLADGVCCNQACTDLCLACSVETKASGSLGGYCDFAKNGSNPRASCHAADSRTCGFDGTCDGHGQCRNYVAGAACGAACTTSDDCGPRAHCTAGQCAADEGAKCLDDHTLVSASGKPDDCHNYKCVGAQCLTTCNVVADCNYPAQCSTDHQCVASAPFTPAPDPGCRASSARAHTPWISALAITLLVAKRRKRRA